MEFEPSFADETPVAVIPDEARWSENFCIDGYDSTSGVAFWVHCGRWWLDPELWREQVLLFMPDGSYLVHRGFGYRPSDTGPSGPGLSMSCEVPGKVFSAFYRGAARRLTDEDLSDVPLRDGAVHHLQLEVNFDAVHPIWDFGSTSTEVWASSHYEQPGRVTGVVRHDGSEISFDGNGYRDHSRGPRDLTRQHSHCWIHAQFADWAFAIMAVRVLDDDDRVVPAYTKAVVFANGTIHAVEPAGLEFPWLTSLTEPSTEYQLLLATDVGTKVVDVRTDRSLSHTVQHGMDCFDGLAPSLGHLGAIQQPSTFTCDGETVPGHTERTTRLY